MANGRPLGFDYTKHCKAVVKAIPLVIAVNQVAGMCGIPKSTLKDWIKYGDNDLIEGIDSDLAKFSAAVRKVQADVVSELIYEMRVDDKKFRVNSMLLERCFREDFGADSGIITELQQTFVDLKARFDEQNKK